MATNKINRNYKLSIDLNVRPKDASASTVANQPVEFVPESTLEIEFPLTIEFDISRSIGQGANEMNLKIYNLSEKSRALIVKDPYNNQWASKDGAFTRISLQAGYDQNLYPIFIGNLIEAYSERSGVDVITHCRVVTGAFGLFNTFINQSFGANTSNQEIINGIINKLVASGTVQKGAITAVDGVALTGFQAVGDSFQLLTQYGPVFVDLDKINILKINEVLKNTFGKTNQVTLVDSSTGLLGVPLRRDTFIEVHTIFEPSIILGQLVEIVSEIDKRYNGQYKVYGIEHKGVISGSKNAPLITVLRLFIGNQYVKTFQEIQ